MAKVRLLGGKPLLVGGKVALAAGCCCNTGLSLCPPPSSGACPNSICFDFNPDGPMVDGYWDNGSLIILRNFNVAETDVFRILPYFFDDGTGATFAGVSAGFFGFTITGQNFIETPMSAANFFAIWHTIGVTFINLGGGILQIVLTAFGQTTTFDYQPSGLPSADFYLAADQLFVGCESPSNPEAVSIRNVFINEGACVTEDFSFPPDTFDSTVGSGQSIVSGTVRISAGAGVLDGYLKAIVLDFQCKSDCSPCNCKHGGDLCESNATFSIVNVSFSASGTKDDCSDLANPCCFAFSPSLSKTYVLAPYPASGTDQFYVVCDGSCNIGAGGFDDQSADFPVDGGPCSGLPPGCNGDIQSIGSYKFRFTISQISGASCGVGTYRISVFGGVDLSCSVINGDFHCTGYGCLYDPGDAPGPDSPCGNLGFDYCDHQDVSSFSSIPGAYNFSNTITGGTSNSTVTFNITVSIG